MRFILMSLLLGTGVRAGAATDQQEAAPALAAASLQAPGLDVARLNHFFDAARSGLRGLVDPPAGIQMPKKPENPAAFISPAIRTLPARRPLVVRVPPVSPAYRRTFNQLLTRPLHTDQYDDAILENAQKQHLDARLMKAIVAAESSFSPKALSPRGALGLMQLMPSTAREMGIDASHLREPAYNIAAGAAYMAWLFKTAWRKYKLKGVRYHDVPQWLIQRIIAAYNAGPRFLFRDDFYPETRAYVRKVLLFYQSAVTDLRRPSRAAAEQPAPSLPEAALN